jgi:hypothetical protein
MRLCQVISPEIKNSSLFPKGWHSQGRDMRPLIKLYKRMGMGILNNYQLSLRLHAGCLHRFLEV